MLARTVISANLARKMDETRTFCRTCVGGQIGCDGGWHAITRLSHAVAALAPRTTFEHDAACQTQDVSGTVKGNLRMRNRAAGLHARRCSACVHTAVICFASHATRRRRFIIHPNTARARSTSNVRARAPSIAVCSRSVGDTESARVACPQAIEQLARGGKVFL